MLDYAVVYREAIDTVTQRHDLGLHKFELVDSDWEIVSQLQDVLKILKDATLFFSRGTPNLAKVIPAMDLIDERLTTYSHNKKYSPSICAAVCLAKQTLNWYYQLTDKSEVYRIAMVLHPHHKLAYFKNARWEDARIETVATLVCDEFERSYLEVGIQENGDDIKVSNTMAHEVCVFLYVCTAH
ncbi:hypothetical protein BDR05DRAFT_878096 [Suillus weaverae]|nr:hypothetical protein BDR05DRAFT_878096 [Suillus weaverae]